MVSSSCEPRREVDEEATKTKGCGRWKHAGNQVPRFGAWAMVLTHAHDPLLETDHLFG